MTGLTPLHVAAVHLGDTAGQGISFSYQAPYANELVRLLLAHGADPTVRDASGNTPLYLAQHVLYSGVLPLSKPGGAFLPHECTLEYNQMIIGMETAKRDVCGMLKDATRSRMNALISEIFAKMSLPQGSDLEARILDFVDI